MLLIELFNDGNKKKTDGIAPTRLNTNTNENILIKALNLVLYEVFPFSIKIGLHSSNTELDL